MRINHNIASLNTYRQLSSNNVNSGKSLEKLSSGLRINRAGDDAAGLAISEKMRAQIKGLNMASKNSQDGISLIQTAEGALGETQSILQRMRELAVQSSNDTNVSVDRDQIQKEISQLTSEVNRIGTSTEFNTMKLLNGDKARSSTSTQTTALGSGTKDVALITGYTVTATNSTNLRDAIGTITTSATGEFVVDGTTGGANAAITIDKTSATTLKITVTSSGAGTLSAIDTFEVSANLDANGNFVYNQHGVSFSMSSADFANISAGSSVAITGFTATSSSTISVKNDWTSNTGNVTLNSSIITVTANAENATARTIDITAHSAGGTVNVAIKDSAGTTLYNDTYSANTTTLNYNSHGISFTLDTTNASQGTTVNASISISSLATTTTTTTYGYSAALTFQVGANQDQVMKLNIEDMRSAALGIASTASGTANFRSTAEVTDGASATLAQYALDVSTASAAATAITKYNDAINTVSQERSKLGAVQNRLEHTIANLDASAENLQASESRIRDVDMAKEMMEFTKNNILTQAAQSMLAQANQQPQGVLSLLR